MKCGQETRLGKRNTETSKKLALTSCWQIVLSLLSNQFMVDLEQSKSTFMLKRLKAELENLRRCSRTINLNKASIFAEK